MAELADAPDLESGGRPWGFKSLSPDHIKYKGLKAFFCIIEIIMKKRKNILGTILIITIVFIGFILIISTSDNGVVKNAVNINKLKIVDIFTPKNIIDINDFDIHLSVDVLDEGYDIYVPNKSGYRYGPSIINNEDGTRDAWFASNGNSKEWDWITYRHFDGENWSNEEIVLRPTPNSKDHYSTCDPGVIYFNGYYYLGYTSTENAKNGGVENCGYVARSENPNGPFEKWNGNGWGGNPEPIIIYDEADSQWGAGEISFVVMSEKLFCYYSWISDEGNYTKLAVADLIDDWPSTLQEKGIVIEKVSGQDSCDVVFVDGYEKFLAFCVESRFLDTACLAVYESDDGLHFKQVDRIRDINKYSHNMGISKDPNGHINMDDDLVIGYAYGNSAFNTWGRWSTKIQSVKLKLLTKKKD